MKTEVAIKGCLFSKDEYECYCEIAFHSARAFDAHYPDCPVFTAKLFENLEEKERAFNEREAVAKSIAEEGTEGYVAGV